MNEYEIIKFKNDDIELSVNVSPSEDTVWLQRNKWPYYLIGIEV